MQMFTVPQFIDAEDKIIGAMTVRQFIIALAGMAVIGIGWKIFDFSLFIVWAIINFVVFGAFAFIKINGRPFHYFALNLIQTTKKPRLRVWNHKNPLKDAMVADADRGEAVHTQVKVVPIKPRPAGSRLRELSLVVDTKGAYKGGEDEEIME
jgi:hypothetical protein